MNEEERARIAAINRYAAGLESELDELYLDEDVELGVNLTSKQLENLSLRHVSKLTGKNRRRFEEMCALKKISSEKNLDSYE